jgi:hypothetical protein
MDVRNLRLNVILIGSAIPRQVDDQKTIDPWGYRPRLHWALV